MLENKTLEEAIEIFERKSPNAERNHDRRQIVAWLKELKVLREEIKNVCANCEYYINYDGKISCCELTYDYTRINGRCNKFTLKACEE